MSSKTVFTTNNNTILVHFLKGPKIVLGHLSPGYTSRNTHEWRRINLLLSPEKVQKYFLSSWKQGKGLTVSQCVDLAASVYTDVPRWFHKPPICPEEGPLASDKLISITLFLSYEIPWDAKVSGAWGKGSKAKEM